MRSLKPYFSNIRSQPRMAQANKSFDTDTHRQGAAQPAGDQGPRGALPVRAGQLRR
jgi:hypothetical protein